VSSWDGTRNERRRAHPVRTDGLGSARSGRRRGHATGLARRGHPLALRGTRCGGRAVDRQRRRRPDRAPRAGGCGRHCRCRGGARHRADAEATPRPPTARGRDRRRGRSGRCGCGRAGVCGRRRQRTSSGGVPVTVAAPGDDGNDGGAGAPPPEATEGAVPARSPGGPPHLRRRPRCHGLRRAS
jgi:hypothetical protein